MTLKRDQFIEELIAALKENEELVSVSTADAAPIRSITSPGGAESDEYHEFTGFFTPQQSIERFNSAAQWAAEAYAILQFDFPQVDDAKIRALAEKYRSFALSSNGSNHSVNFVDAFPITITLVDGIAYLNERHVPNAISRAATDQKEPPGLLDRSSEACGLLAASVLLFAFRHCLENADAHHVQRLLTKLYVPLNQADIRPDSVATSGWDGITSTTLTARGEQNERDEYEEKYAAEEDPDDLSLVYEGEIPTSQHQLHHMHPVTSNHVQKSIASYMTVVDKLRFLSHRTFTSSFAFISSEKWDEWHIEEELIAVMRFLVNHDAETTNDYGDSRTLFGVEGEWSRYLYIYRDRLLRFPAISQQGIWRLKEFIEWMQPSSLTKPISMQRSRTQNGSTLENEPVRRRAPHQLVYRVLAELAVSKEFQQRSAQRAQQGLALVILDLLPLITLELQQVAAKNCQSSYILHSDDDDMIVILLQLMHFLLSTAANGQTVTAKLHESGILRALLSLLPVASGDSNSSSSTALDSPWFSPLFRLVGICALWNSEFAEYSSRVPKVVAILPQVKEHLPGESMVLSLAFYQHNVPVESSNAQSVNANIWSIFISTTLFPKQCSSYMDAMKKLQNAIFVLESLINVFPTLRKPMQDELRRSLQQIYPSFSQAFVYEATAPITGTTNREETLEDKKVETEERGEAEALQFAALRNRLRFSVKTLLLSVSSIGIQQGAQAATSSKLD